MGRKDSNSKKGKKNKSKQDSNDWPYGMSTTGIDDHTWIDFSSTIPCDKKDSKQWRKCKGKKCKKQRDESKSWWTTSSAPSETTKEDNTETTTTTAAASTCVTVEGILDPNNACFCFNDDMERCPADRCNVFAGECVDVMQSVSDNAMRHVKDV